MAQDNVLTNNIAYEDLEEYALTFADNFTQGADLQVGDIIPIYDTSNNIAGYSIEYYQGDIPYGYINLDFRFEDPVTEFSIDENVQSTYVM